MEVNPVLFESIFPEGLFAISPPPIIILGQPWETLPSTEKALLEKILTAIKQSLNSVTIQYQNPLDLSALAVKPKCVIHFGKTVKGIPLYETVEANGVTIVASESLKDLSGNEDSRKRLWQALKKQFSV
jgi:DNA polymerase III psi subunit